MGNARRFWNLFRNRLSLAIPGLLALIAVLMVNIVGVRQVDRVGLGLFDAYQRAAPRPYQDAGVRIVDIDDESIQKLGQWPWPRTDIAALTQKLTEAGAAVVAYDVVFSEPDRTSPAQLASRAKAGQAPADVVAALESLPDNDAAFAQVLANSNVVLGFFLDGNGKGATVEPKAGIAYTGSKPNGWKVAFTNAIQPIPVLREATRGLGSVSRIGDSDGVVRQAPLMFMQNGEFVPSLSVEALRIAQPEVSSVIVKTSDASGELGEAGGRVDMAAIKVGGFEVPTNDQGELWMYYTKPVPERIVPAWKILTDALPPEEMRRLFEGQIIFVGAGAAGLRDLVSTPMQDRELGVMVHAQAAEQMIIGNADPADKKPHFLTRPYWAQEMERGLMLALGILMALLLPWMGATRGAILGAVMVGGMAAGSWLAFRQSLLLLDPTWPILGLILVWVCETAYTYYREERQRAYIHRAFDRYLSPELVKRIADDPSRLELGGETREMTVMFCDIRSFSRISEKLDAQQLIRFLIAFLTPMTDVLLRRKATIDKFIGDAILAFWNAPLDDEDQYANAARGALEMAERLKSLNAQMQAQSAEPWPGDVAIGIGLNAGPCCVGNMGSAQRLSYSLIGDTVNLASRIEGLTKYYGVTIAIGDDLQKHIPNFATVPLDLVRVVGRDAPELVYVLLGDETMMIEPGFQSFAEKYTAMGNAYRAQDWDKADALLAETAESAASHGLAKHHALMASRVAAYRENGPGADWDGVFGATEK
ncbi:adenylate/guanylate cyclase domain-containing protein [Sphingomonas sp. AOB5]|uniref:CHASE2 domain-containing protein n=1 Tax=Sphingomonas sp. AOB5 TaxID=3034017 RepID=UPI0023F8F310|nr:adenylate/guanylate cyclase domain-containing protein [Sphingomonas sp. AOB5]MDF7776423.1 adenylate/guanylate cyclase domain-containing protein [Sphingomonas sp. AOB5]